MLDKSGAKSRSTAAMAAPPEGPSAREGSNVREAFKLMSALLFPSVPVPFLDLSAQILQRRHMETVFEERAVQRLCGFPACGNRLSECDALDVVAVVDSAGLTVAAAWTAGRRPSSASRWRARRSTTRSTRTSSARRSASRFAPLSIDELLSVGQARLMGLLSAIESARAAVQARVQAAAACAVHARGVRHREPESEGL